MKLAIVFLIVFAPAVVGQEKKPAPTPDRVRVLAFSPDGKLLAANCGDLTGGPGCVAIVDVEAAKVLHRVKRKVSGNGIAFTPDGSVVAAAGTDGTVLVLKPKNATEKLVLVHPKEVKALAFCADGKSATACADGFVRLWDTTAGNEIGKMSETRQPVTALAVSPDGTRVAGVADRELFVWDTMTGKPVRGPVAVYAYIWLEFSPDGRWLIQNDSGNGEILVENAETWKAVARFKTKGGTSRTAYAPKADLVVTNYAFRLNEATVTRLRLDGPTSDETNAISDSLVRLDADDVSTRESARKTLLAIGPVAEPSLRKAMKESASAEVRLQARKIRDTILSTPAATFVLPTERVTALALSPDGTRLAVGDTAGVIHVVSMKDGERVANIETAP